MGHPIKSLTISGITVDESLQFRADGTNPETVDEYAKAMTAGKTLPPIVVYRDSVTGSLWLSEGFHRIAAARKAGLKKIEAEVRPGNYRDAKLNSLGSNQIHGLKRTNRDKRNVVSEYIRFCPDWSDRRISEAAGVSQPLVSKVRQDVEVITVITSTDSQTSESRTGLDGKTRHVAPKALAASADPVEDSDGVDGDGESVADAGDAGDILADAEVILSEKPAGGAVILPPQMDADDRPDDVRANREAEAAEPTAAGKAARAGAVPTHDGWGIPIQPHAAEAFDALPKFRELLAAIRHTQKLFDEVANLKGGMFLTLPGVASYLRGRKTSDGGHEGRFVHAGLERAYAQVKNAVPTYTVCPYQYAEAPHPEDCRCCLNHNWTPVLGSSIPPSCIERAQHALGASN